MRPIGFEQALLKLLIVFAGLTCITVVAALSKLRYLLQKQLRRPSLTRLASKTQLFGSRALLAVPNSPIVLAQDIPRQSSAMRLRSLSLSRSTSRSRDPERALRSPERGMNAMVWRLDDREERREQGTLADDQPRMQFQRSSSILRGRNRHANEVAATPATQQAMSYYVPGWNYSSGHRQTQSSPVYHAGQRLRPASATEPRVGPSPAPTPLSFLRPPSASSTLLTSRPPSIVPLLSNGTPLADGASSSAAQAGLPQSQIQSHHHKHQSSPATLLCFSRRLSFSKPRFSSRRCSLSSKKPARHSIAVADRAPELSPLRFKSPNQPKDSDLVVRSKMSERPLSNMTNRRRRTSSIDIERPLPPRFSFTPATEAEDPIHAYERFSYHSGPGPVMVDATVHPLRDTPTFRKENVAMPVKGRARMVDVKGKGRVKSLDITKQMHEAHSKKHMSLDLGSASRRLELDGAGSGMGVRDNARVMKGWKDKPLPRLPRTSTTPWIEDVERGVGFEPFEVVFD